MHVPISPLLWNYTLTLKALVMAVGNSALQPTLQ